MDNALEKTWVKPKLIDCDKEVDDVLAHAGVGSDGSVSPNSATS